MDFYLILENLTNPSLLFFILGIVAVYLKSDLEIPPNSSKFISLYLLFAIGFKGGQEMSREILTLQVFSEILFALATSILVPLYTFFLLRKRLNVYDSGAVAAAYGSISAVTFVVAVTYLEGQDLILNGHMVAIMALMEAPAIVVGLILINKYDISSNFTLKKRTIIKHSFTNGSVLLIIGSLFIGFLASEEQALGIKPFTTDIFQGFLAIFLLDMGITSGRKLKSLFSYGAFPLAFGILIPILNGVATAYFSGFFTDDISNRFILAVLSASASYIAVPAAMKVSVPKANPGLFLPMALAITFPVNITLGLPLYFLVVQYF
ncbi:MAG: sodium-dependent bicarbonate transport family permease [Saprospirales bacterium]|nr:MAG: sodium-dependent bicarbonate transport family permease [Saprospirales bacterium]